MKEPDYLKGLRETELEICDVFDAFCRRHQLRYTLSWGTLLGAIRHAGFIPWDDDIDVAMPREDYNKLLALWEKEAPEGFILQNKATNWDFTQNFSKIRKDHTTFAQGEFEKTVSYHTGIFIDVFPADRTAPHRLARKRQIIAGAINLLYARGFPSEAKGAQGIFERLLLAAPQSLRKRVYFHTTKVISKWNRCTGNEWMFAPTFEDLFRVYSPTLFDGMTEIPFEDRKYCCTREADNMLQVNFGKDYLQLPPENERVFKHNHLIVSLDRNRDEITEQERQAK